ncbi:MAG: prepilin-type N-terminal cleavage/methylation domain-containing protein [Lachnobacterium sp.]|nr:prepilin-type N-terminal cleavage/methylation domain-containing protein [Lachnobacterium sp.]MDY5461723.1 prepilin-type N-terminal cleavage/methylation domain-containing protein [Agathobacter sp.]
MRERWFEKRRLRDQRGITLVEIIIVIAIVGILASTAVMMIGHLHYADTQKVMKTLDASLNQLQVKSISKSGNYYLYIYHLDNGYYEQILPDNLSEEFDATKLTKDGTKLSNNTIKLCQDGTELAENSFMKIAYTKQATFDTANTTVQTILIDGVPKYSIRLVMETGKHFVESN